MTTTKSVSFEDFDIELEIKPIAKKHPSKTSVISNEEDTL